MIDKKTEFNIRTVKDFLEFWNKFHTIYREISSQGIITADDEQRFLDLRDAMHRKYNDLTSGLDFRYSPHGRLTDPVNDILMLQNIRFISEKNIKKVDDDWRDSYVFLNSILERLDSKRRRLGQFNPVGVFFKKMRKRKNLQTEVLK